MLYHGIMAISTHLTLWGFSLPYRTFCISIQLLLLQKKQCAIIYEAFLPCMLWKGNCGQAVEKGALHRYIEPFVSYYWSPLLPLESDLLYYLWNTLMAGNMTVFIVSYLFLDYYTSWLRRGRPNLISHIVFLYHLEYVRMWSNWSNAAQDQV
jgi:hypothetical protein